MIWALLALLGVPIWLVLGALMAAFVSRRSFQKSEGVFPLRIRESSATKFQRKAHARWVHDVLLVNKGLALVRTTAYGIESLRILDSPGEPIKGLGDSVAFIGVSIDGGDEAMIAVPLDVRDMAKGTF